MSHTPAPASPEVGHGPARSTSEGHLTVGDVVALVEAAPPPPPAPPPGPGQEAPNPFGSPYGQTGPGDTSAYGHGQQPGQWGPGQP